MSGGVLVVEQPVARLVIETGENATTALVAVQQAVNLVAVAEQGPSGPGETGFGQITYTDRTIGPEDNFSRGVRAQLTFVPNPSLTQDFLNQPFAGHVFWQNNRLVAREMGDQYDVQINLIVTAQEIGGQVRVDADVGSALGPIASDTQVLLSGAGVPERVSFRLKVQVLSNFIANGAAIYLTSNVPLQVVSETVLVAPVALYAT